MKPEQQIITWLKQDNMRMQALRIAASLNLHDWCVGAGFIRNMVWDKLHGYSEPTRLNDIDLIYFDSSKVSHIDDVCIENNLQSNSDLPWSVKNQARMHLRNNDAPYTSTEHAMSHWVELETAIGVSLSQSGDMYLVAPFGVDVLFTNTITINPYRLKPNAFKQRIKSKDWLEKWPNLNIVD